jgi:hypothetical protein
MNGTIKCAIYARFSSDLPQATSIEDQIRQCREFAIHQGWSVVEEFVRFDEAKIAATMAGCTGIADREREDTARSVRLPARWRYFAGRSAISGVKLEIDEEQATSAIVAYPQGPQSRNRP